MSNPFATSEEYRAALLRLGEMVHFRKPDVLVGEYYESLCRGEETSDIFPAFAVLRAAFGLEPPEAMCVALWLYHDASPLPPLTTGELLEQCRRIGRRSPRQILGSLFVADGERAVLHPIVADFLLERELRLPKGLELAVPAQKELLHAELFDELFQFLEPYLRDSDPFPLIVALCGEPGSGRGFLISQLCRRLGATLLKADMRARPPAGDLLLAAKLYGSLVCLEYAEDAGAVGEITNSLGFAFARCEAPLPQSPEYTVLSRNIPALNAEAREKILRKLLSGVPLEEDVPSDIMRRRLSIGRMQSLARSLAAESRVLGRPVDVQALRRILAEQNPPGGEGTDAVQCPGGLNDLVLPPDLQRQLAELCAFVKNRDTVYKTWGFGNKVPWGRGISALFYGAPGTGKTMAAAMMANEVGLPLLRADISQLMSKYIGETQKNIGKIFDEAAKRDGILFFDEADAIFTRRSEASDAQDRYANAETAYLLQRMEQHDGVCILATNLLQNFDEAFRRRIGYMLHFPLPDAEMREKIWRGIFPAAAPLEELDYPLLARQLELSGASIKNCAVHAAYLAAINHTPITMRYILEGVKNEYGKQGKTLSPQISGLISIREGAV